MVKLSQVKVGFFRFTVDISQFFGLPEGEIKITLREPVEKEMYDYSLAIRQNDIVKAIKLLQSLWADCLEDWTVLKDDADERVDRQTMIDIIRKSSGASIHLVQEWQKALPCMKLSGNDTEKSEEPTLKAAE